MPDPKTKNHEDIFKFLRARFQSPEPFTRQDLAAAVPGLALSSVNTYWSKWIKHFCIPVGKGEYLVSESFRRYATWDKFQRYVSSQVRGAATTYTASSHEHLIIYEFFMPLRNEEHLRAALDALFYEDTIFLKLKAVGLDAVRKQFPGYDNESDGTYLERVGQWIAERFGGYSISHVSGRFRVDENLLTASVAAEAQLYGSRYLIDETTAIVKFIFPCGRRRLRRLEISGTEFEEDEDGDIFESEPEVEANLIRWFFRVLFVRSILQIVSGEDEIWMIESGMENRLHIWRMDEA